ncbi:hypothetical protein GUJ93_ZPchr0006g41975 [Zizania palustris]|uniref:DUF547 domain-containing protein n=1 Tax=Zizania palustris TaxID=103762 RepID=A0A8J5T809_ZIZPA|nr:hypothetical protein GUJ93_ZPchr0006g41975 [Zizania palustris]
MNCDERLAFWINLYNALIMHAYLAYGVPENDIKLFSLMQKACYMVGGQSFSAAEIEFVILKMKTPVHRPQLSLMLALHKFRVTEEHKKCSIDDAEPLVLFALSCGMFSSPAVSILLYLGFPSQNVYTSNLLKKLNLPVRFGITLYYHTSRNIFTQKPKILLNPL